jgi:hypothetical protein
VVEILGTAFTVIA